MAQSKITPRADNYAQWYQDVIAQADLAEAAGIVKGCMVIKPHGYAIWEKIQAALDRRFKATGHAIHSFFSNLKNNIKHGRGAENHTHNRSPHGF